MLPYAPNTRIIHHIFTLFIVKIYKCMSDPLICNYIVSIRFNRLQISASIYNNICLVFMTKRNIESASYEGAAKLIKVPFEIKECIKRFSTTYEQRQADDNNNLVRHSVLNQRCLICEQFFSQKHLQLLAVCRHSFCVECLHNYLLYKITVNEEIECPQSDCKEIISKKQSCYQQIPQRYKNRYEKFKLSRQSLSSLSTTAQLLCQAPNCKGVIDISQPQMKCDTCKFEMCRKCHLKKHHSACDNAFPKNFYEWRVCPDCKVFNQINANRSDNKIKCRCGHLYCFVCRESWTEAHQMCNTQADTSLQDDVFCRSSIMNSNRCLNFLRSILLVICIPFVLILILLATILTIIGATFFAILFSPCLSFQEFDSYPKAIFCFPCVGLYKIGQFIKRYVGSVCSIGCDFMGRLAMTIKAGCCYSRSQLDMQGTKIQYVN